MIRYEVGDFERDQDQIQKLAIEHFNEVGYNGGPKTLDIDFELYISAQRDGAHASYNAIKDDKIIGYVMAFIGSCPHHRSILIADVDALFLTKKERKGLIAINMIKYFEYYLKTYRHVKYMRLHTNSNKDLSSLATFLRYEESDIVYTKCIGDI